jgi:hypothetical protein
MPLFIPIWSIIINTGKLVYAVIIYRVRLDFEMLIGDILIPLKVLVAHLLPTSASIKLLLCNLASMELSIKSVYSRDWQFHGRIPGWPDKPE